jgi:hypothetical protein
MNMARTRNDRAVAVAMLMAVAVVVALVALLTTKPADAAPGFKVVTKSFSSTTAIAIPSSGSAAPYPSEKNVGGFNRGKILDVNLALKNFTHQFSDDVDVMLSHRGVNRTVFSDVGGNNAVNNMTIKLDNEASSLLPDETVPTGGSFKPANFAVSGVDTFPLPAPTPISGLESLSGFDGSNPNGVWRLWVTDDIGGGVGQFAGGWSITIKAKVPR